MCEQCNVPFCLCESDAKLSAKMLFIKKLTPAALKDPEFLMMVEDLI